ncbi:MAG: SusC/RagA family TonB-linked outer membrane protein [Bacteroidota bacterium]
MKKFLLSFIALVFAFLQVSAQERTVSGKVISIEDGSALPGVNVIVKGTTNGSVTDIDGNYRISVPAEGGILVFSFIGLATEEVEIGARSVLDLQMSPDVQQLSEVIVTAVGIEQNKRALGYSVQNVAGDDVIRSGETNIVNALNSKAAGVTVVSSAGSPGASANIRIRGNTSINGSNSPLFVIDGVPIDNSDPGNGVGGVDRSNRAIDLNPNDVESLTVLKGPAATALYGIRAANGAIIITTKKGTNSSKPTVNISAGVTFDRINKIHDFQNEYAQGAGGNYRGPENGTGSSWGPLVSSLEYATDPDAANAPSSDVFFNGQYAFDRNGYLVPSGTGNGTPANTYDKEDFFVTGVTQDYNISVSGGGENVNYFISAGNYDQSGIVPNAEWKRRSFRSNINAQLTERLSAGISAYYANSGGQRIQRGSNISGIGIGLYRTAPTFDNTNGLDSKDAADDPSSYILPDGSQRAYRYNINTNRAIYDNPYWIVNNIPFFDNVDRLTGYITTAYDITDWMKVSYKLGLDYFSEENLNAFDIGTASTPAGSVIQTNRVNTDINSDLLLLISKDINEDLNISATLGHNYYSSERTINTATGNTLGAQGFYHISNATDIQATQNILERELYGVFGEFRFDYKNMVFLNISGRNDWSSLLPEDNNSFFYPAVSAGVDITEVLGQSNNPTIPYAKLRASWGQVGSDAPFFYATSSVYVSAVSGGDGFTDGITFPAFGVNAFERDFTLGNPNLEPETTTTIELGADLKFLNGRVGLDLTWYKKNSEDQILAVDVAPTTGVGSIIRNGGEIENTGIEILLTGTPVTVGDFSWDVGINFTHFESDVVDLPDDIGEAGIFLAGFTSTSSRVIEGQPYGALFGNRFARNEEGRLIIGSNGWPLQDPTDGVIGDPTPDWLAGISNTWSYKGFSLTALLDIRSGGDIWNGSKGVLNFFGVTQETADQRTITGYVFDGVKADSEGNATEAENNIPVDFGLGGDRWTRYAFGGLSEESIEDGSWVRLREVTLSYNLPSKLFQGNFISGGSISLTGRNLFLITEYTGIDPEVNLTGASNGYGLEYFGLPNTRSYGVRVNLSF